MSKALKGIVFQPNHYTEDERRTCLFGRTQTQLLGQEIYVNLFSVPTVGRGPIASVKDRAIVRHEGSDDGEGDWKCSLCKKAIKCQHITVSRRHFKQLLANDVHVADSLDDDTTVEYSSGMCFMSYLPNALA